MEVDQIDNHKLNIEVSNWKTERYLADIPWAGVINADGVTWIMATYGTVDTTLSEIYLSPPITKSCNNKEMNVTVAISAKAFFDVELPIDLYIVNDYTYIQLREYEFRSF